MPAPKIILLVEDNPDDVELTTLALQEANIVNKVVVVRDGVEALDYLFSTGAYASPNRGEAPAVVLLDIKLPKINGLEVLQKMRGDHRTRFLPVVILTSSREEQDMVSGYSLGCNSYIRKPVDFAKFTDAVRQLGCYWLLLNETPGRTGS
ncbi:MAG TPA: response regulator [Planctomycetota bacterium]|nr:response regulator [Planctomycetota bacterium]